MNNSISKSPLCSFQALVTISCTTCDLFLSFLTHWSVRFGLGFFFWRLCWISTVACFCELYLSQEKSRSFIIFLTAGHGRWNGAGLSGLHVAGLIHYFECRLSAFSREEAQSLPDVTFQQRLWTQWLTVWVRDVPCYIIKKQTNIKGPKVCGSLRNFLIFFSRFYPMTRKFCMFSEWGTTSHSKPPALSPTATHRSGISPVRNSPSGQQIVKAAIKPWNLLIPLFPPLIS